jgi:hypothetical protein
MPDYSYRILRPWLRVKTLSPNRFVLFFCLHKRKVPKEKCTTNAAQRNALAPIRRACRPPLIPRFAPLRSWTSARFSQWKERRNFKFRWNDGCQIIPCRSFCKSSMPIPLVNIRSFELLVSFWPQSTNPPSPRLNEVPLCMTLSEKRVC